jgi:hypothetical protein
LQRLWTIVLGAALVTGVTVPAQAAKIQNAGSGLCLQPAGGLGSWNGSLIRQVPCSPHDNSHLWYIQLIETVHGDHWYQIVNKRLLNPDLEDPHLCLDLTDGDTADGKLLQLWECTFSSTSTTMMWKFVGGKIINRRSGKCMDVRRGSLQPRALIQSYHCADLPGGAPNAGQLFNLISE